MENEKEETLNEDVETSQNDEVVEETEETTEDTDTDTPTLEDYNELQKKNKELYERAKKAEALAKSLKEVKAESKPTLKTKTNLPEEDLIRTAKLASQLDDDDLEVLKTINGDSLAEKVDNPLFKAYKEQKLKKAKSEAAALKPYASSNSYVNGIKPDMSEEEHRKMWQKLTS